MNSSPTSWVASIKPGDALRVLKHTRLWPIEMWYSTSDEDTVVVVTPIITPGDICGVIDVLKDDGSERIFAALVVCSEGVGCILAEAEYFTLL